MTHGMRALAHARRLCPQQQRLKSEHVFLGMPATLTEHHFAQTLPDCRTAIINRAEHCHGT